MIGFYVAIVLMAALVAIEAWLIYGLVTEVAVPFVRERLRQREVVRRSAIDQQMQAARAAQQLSMLAWKARHQMYDMATEERRSSAFGDHSGAGDIRRVGGHPERQS